MVQTELDIEEVKLPALHVEQEVADWMDDEYIPTEHRAHTEPPIPVEYAPEGHIVQTELEIEEVKLPALHVEQEVADWMDDEYIPTGQLVHADTCDTEYFPTMQLSHDLENEPKLNCPLSQPRQIPRSVLNPPGHPESLCPTSHSLHASHVPKYAVIQFESH
jgi:hypothetical protein